MNKLTNYLTAIMFSSFFLLSASCGKDGDTTPIPSQPSDAYLNEWIGNYEGQATEVKTVPSGGTSVESVPVDISISKDNSSENELMVLIEFMYSTPQQKQFEFQGNVDRELNKLILKSKNFIDDEDMDRVSRNFSNGEAFFITDSNNLGLTMDESKYIFIVDDEKELLYESSHDMETNVK